MGSTFTLSPPTSWVSAAMSVVEVTTFSFLACAGVNKPAASSANSKGKNNNRNVTFMDLLKRMCAVGAQREHDLHQQLMSVDITCIVSETILATNLAELAWPVCQNSRASLIRKAGEFGTIGVIIAATDEPTPP